MQTGPSISAAEQVPGSTSGAASSSAARILKNCGSKPALTHLKAKNGYGGQLQSVCQPVNQPKARVNAHAYIHTHMMPLHPVGHPGNPSSSPRLGSPNAVAAAGFAPGDRSPRSSGITCAVGRAGPRGGTPGGTLRTSAPRWGNHGTTIGGARCSAGGREVQGKSKSGVNKMGLEGEQN